MSENHRLPFLYQVARTISAELDTDEVLQKLMGLTHEYFQPDAVSVALVEPDGSVAFRAASGESSVEVVGMHLARGAGIAGWVADRGEPVWSPDVHSDPRFFPGVDQQTGFITTAILATPVKLGEQTLAVLEMINPGPDTNLEEAQEIMTTLASLAAPAIQNARLFEQVHRAEERYQRLFELNLDPIVIIDDRGNVLEFNQAAQNLLSLEPEVLESPNPVFVSEPQEVLLGKLGLSPAQFESLKPKVTAGEVAAWEYRVTTEATVERILEVKLSYLAHYRPGDAYQWLAHDITDRVVLEEMRQRLANMIVHDLRVPLGSILNSLELALTAWRDKDITIPVDQILQIALRNANRMERLISNILDTARLQSKEKTISVSTIHIPELVADAMEVILPTVKRREHTVIRKLQDDLPPMEGDADLLRRVLINILGNAVQYTDDGGTIVLTVGADEDNVYFSVGDNGPGISPEDQPHLFELFFRGKTQKTKGAGLGLAFCKLVVEAHGGRIWLASEVGKGSTFFFSLPRRRPESNETGPAGM